MKNLTWEEFSGATLTSASNGFFPTTATAAEIAAATPNAEGAYNGWAHNAYSGTGGTGKSLGFKQIPTTGSILVLDMGRVIQLPQEFDAPGNIGQFSLQITANCSNPHKQSWNSNEYELVVIVCNSGVLILSLIHI